MEILKKIVEENPEKPHFYIRNLLRQYLQILILEYIYSSKKYNDLFFYGGTCLALCYKLPRLSEDLDFVDEEGSTDMEMLASDVKVFLEKTLGLEIDVKVQKFRIYFKFPILKDLGLSEGKGGSNLLFVKLEIFSDFGFCKSFQKEFKPLFKFNRSVLVKTFDLSTLMSTKILAVLSRSWQKKDKKGNVLTQVKGRDFFDLMWFLQNNVEPNYDCFKETLSKKELKLKLLEKIEGVDAKSIAFDLENFVEDVDFARNLGEKMKDILKVEIESF